MKAIVFSAFVGGCLIGFSAVLMLLFNGKILGVSGILGGIFQRSSEPKYWRYLFLVGVFFGGLIILVLSPGSFDFTLERSSAALILGGLLVGYGTRLGGGCTSGHGVCGVSRFSLRSIIATLIFMASGALTVFIVRTFYGGRI